MNAILNKEEVEQRRDLIRFYESEISRLKSEIDIGLRRDKIVRAASVKIRRDKVRSAVMNDVEMIYRIIKENKSHMFTADICDALNNHLDRNGRDYNSSDFCTMIGKYLKEDPRFTESMEENPRGGRPSKQYGLTEW